MAELDVWHGLCGFLWHTRHINPYPAKKIYLTFHPLEVVSRYRDPQLQVGENYAYVFILKSNVCKF